MLEIARRTDVPVLSHLNETATSGWVRVSTVSHTYRLGRTAGLHDSAGFSDPESENYAMTAARTTLTLAEASGSLWAIRSESATMYLLDATSSLRIMRIPGPGSSRGWWDHQWAPLLVLRALLPADGSTPPQDVAGEVRVGWRAFWSADPGGAADANSHFWLQRMVTEIEGPLTPGQIAELTGR